MTTYWGKIKGILTKSQDLTAVGTGNIVSSAISGIFWFYLASLLGTEKYGEVSYFIAIAAVASTISFLGAGNAIIVYTAKGEKIQAPMFFISIISGIITSVAIFFMFSHIGVSFYIIGHVIFSLAIADLLGKKFYKSYTKHLIAQKILMVILSLGFYYLFDVPGVVLGIALSFFPHVFIIYKSWKESKMDFSMLRLRFGFIMNSYTLDLARTFSYYTDRLIIMPIFGFVILGNYQLGIQVLAILNIVPTIVYQYILPQDASGNSNVKLRKLTIISSVILAILGVILAPIILPILFPEYIEAVEVVQIISISVIPQTVNLLYISKFLAKEISKVVVIGSGVYVFIQILLIIILGEIFGVNGIAMSVLFASSAEAIFLILIKKILYNSIDDLDKK